jgi:hypothetical protein
MSVSLISQETELYRTSVNGKGNNQRNSGGKVQKLEVSKIARRLL